MRNKIFALTVFAVVLTATAFGSWSNKLAVEVPFDFYVGNEVMPAGTYVIDGTTPDGGVMTITNRARGRKLVVATTPAGQSTTGKSELVFHRSGSTYFLSKVWNATSETGRALPTSRKQREMAQATGEKLTQLALVIEPRR